MQMLGLLALAPSGRWCERHRSAQIRTRRKSTRCESRPAWFGRSRARYEILPAGCVHWPVQSLRQPPASQPLGRCLRAEDRPVSGGRCCMAITRMAIERISAPSTWLLNTLGAGSRRNCAAHRSKAITLTGDRPTATEPGVRIKGFIVVLPTCTWSFHPGHSRHERQFRSASLEYLVPNTESRGGSTPTGKDVDCASGNSRQCDDGNSGLQEHEHLGASRQRQRIGRAEREAGREGQVNT